MEMSLSVSSCVGRTLHLPSPGTWRQFFNYVKPKTSNHSCSQTSSPLFILLSSWSPQRTPCLCGWSISIYDGRCSTADPSHICRSLNPQVPLPSQRAINPLLSSSELKQLIFTQMRGFCISLQSISFYCLFCLPVCQDLLVA